MPNEIKGVCRITVDGENVFHEQNATLSIEVETKERETKDTNGKEFRPGDHTWSMTGDGLLVEDTENSELPFSALFSKLKLKEDVAVEFTPSTTGKLYYYGQALITSLEASSGTNEDPTASWGVQGTGDISEGTISA